MGEVSYTSRKRRRARARALPDAAVTKPEVANTTLQMNHCSEIRPNHAQTWPSTHPDLRPFFAFFDVPERGFNLVL